MDMEVDLHVRGYLRRWTFVSFQDTFYQMSNHEISHPITLSTCFFVTSFVTKKGTKGLNFVSKKLNVACEKL